MLCGETVAVYCEHTDTLCGQNEEVYVLKQVVHIVTTGLETVNDVTDSLCVQALSLALTHLPKYSGNVFTVQKLCNFISDKHKLKYILEE
jgi:hypothetical protein